MIKILAFLMLLTLIRPICTEQEINPVWLLPNEVYRKPNEDICRVVWQVEHSMCNGAALIDFAKIDSAEINSAVGTIKQEMDNLAFKLANPDSRVSKTSYEGLAFYKRFNDESVRANVVASAQRCANHLTKVRSKALCFVCSGSQQNYFFRSKAIVTQQHCSSMVRECEDFFRYSVDLIQGMAVLGTVLGSASSNWGELNNGEKRKIDEFNEIFARFIVKLKNAKLVNILAAKGVSAEVDAQLCARLFMLRKPSFVKIMAFLYSFVNKYIGEFVKVADIWSGRKLESTSDFSEQPFEGDVVILRPTDNMFTSFDGVQGSSLSNDNSASKAMNLTTCFP